MRIRFFVLGLLCFATCNTASAQTGINFWPHWGDGKAEISSFKVVTPRYGQKRSGYDVLVFVTEDLDAVKQIKADDSVGPKRKVPVLKLNHIRKFQTGLYDYALMRSVFSPLTVWKLRSTSMDAITPIKVSFVSTEWCGNYYFQLNRTPSGFRYNIHSYFEGEGDQIGSFDAHRLGFLEENLMIRVRELIARFPAGQYKMLTSAMYDSLERTVPRWVDATVERSAEGTLVRYDISSPVRKYSIWLEEGGAKRIMKWRILSGRDLEQIAEHGELIRSIRSSYWKETDLNGAKLREQLGLPGDDS